MTNFEIVVDQWLAREHGDEIARATLAQLELRSGDRILTFLEDRLARTNRNYANLSAYDLAIWLASNWWRLRWEPERQGSPWRMAHSLGAIGGGYVWPDVTMLSDGEQLTVQVRPAGSKNWEPVRYLENWDCTLSVGEFEAAVDSFINTVLGRLAGYRISGTGLHLLWEELRTERLDPETASVRKLEALLGFDAGTAPDALIDDLLANAQVEGRSAVDEVAAEFGSTAHEILRNDELAGLVGADPSLITGQVSTNVPMPAARWTTPDREAWSVILRSRWEVGKRFDLCRLIADGLVAPEGELLLPATNAKTSRQKFQRAFAQEFLCPSDTLLERLGSLPPEDEEIESAAQYFQVSPLLVRSKLANLNILPRF